jgi:hypothetical protein
MTYRIEGLRPERFAALIGSSDNELARSNALRVVAGSKPGFPCRITLKDAEAGEPLILFNFVSHDVETPFRTAYAIYVRETAREAAIYEDRIPPLFERRILGLRGFDSDGMLCKALLALPGEADQRIREMFADPGVATVHAHNAAHGCFLACIERN